MLYKKYIMLYCEDGTNQTNEMVLNRENSLCYFCKMLPHFPSVVLKDKPGVPQHCFLISRNPFVLNPNSVP